MIIRITTKNEIKAFPYPDDHEDIILRQLIDRKCDTIERVSPKRLYRELRAKHEVTNIPGEAVCMLVDEDGKYHSLPVNLTGSYLYETDIHGSPIVGDILFVGLKRASSSFNFCGIEEKSFESLFPKLEKLCKKAQRWNG